MPKSSGNNFDKLVLDIARKPRENLQFTKYDFTKKEKISQDQQKFLEKIFNQFAESFTTLIATLLEARVQINLVSIKQTPYQHYLNSLPDPVSILVFKVNPETRALIALDYALSFGILDKLMGGKGRPVEELRPLTDLEKAVFRKITDRLLTSFSDSWREVLDLKPQFSNLEFSPLSVHIVSPSEVMHIATYQAKIAHSQGFIDLCIPFAYGKESIPNTSFDEFLLTRNQGVSSQAVVPFFSKSLESAKVPVSIELGTAEVLFQDVLNLQVGDYLRIDKEYTQPLKIKVNERTKFLGRPGVKDHKLAIQITKVLNEEDEEFEE